MLNIEVKENFIIRNPQSKIQNLTSSNTPALERTLDPR
jgi:hypothetical protein